MKWSVKAVESLDNIYAFYAEIHPSIADRLYSQLVEEAEFLIHFPQMAPVEQSLSDKPILFRALVVMSRYKVVYYIEEEFITIADIWDCRQDPDILREKIK